MLNGDILILVFVFVKVPSSEHADPQDRGQGLAQSAVGNYRCVDIAISDFTNFCLARGARAGNRLSGRQVRRHDALDALILAGRGATVAG